jgi:hypothetical protein
MPKSKNDVLPGIEDRRDVDPIAALFLSRRADPTVNLLGADFYNRLPPTVPEDAGSGLSRELGFGDISSTGQQLLDPNRPNVNTIYPADVVSPALFDALEKHPTETQQRMRDFLQRKYGS